MQTQDALWTRSFILLAFSNLLLATAFYFLIPTLPEFAIKYVGADKSQVGLIVAVYALSSLIIRPITGWSIDNFGRKYILIIAMLFFSLIFGLYYFVSTFAMFIILRFIHGISWGVTTSTAATSVIDVIPVNRRGEGIGIFGISFTLAMAIGPLIGLAIRGEDNYFMLFLSTVIFSFAGWLLVLFVKFPKFEANPLNKHFTLKNVFEKRVLPITTLHFLTSITYGSIVSFIPLYFKELGFQSSGGFFFCFAIGIGLSRLLSGKIFDKKGPKDLVVVGLIIAAIGFLMISYVHLYTFLLISGFITGFGSGIVWPAFMAMANNIVEPFRRGAANSTVLTATDLGIGLGSALFGLVVKYFPFHYIFVISSILIIAVIIIFRFITFNHYSKHLLNFK